MDRFEYDSSQLSIGEEQISRAQNIKLYDGDTKTLFVKGDVIITNYRLLWGHPADFHQKSDCLSLPLSCIIYIEEESASAFSFSSSNKLIIHLAPVNQGERKAGPCFSSLNSYIKLSFKHSLDLESSFIQGLKEAVKQRKWDFCPPVPAKNTPSKQAPTIKTRTGIIGIERGLLQKQKETDHNISAAFQDLNKLMLMAKEMVAVAKTISTKIREKQGNISEDETLQFKCYLLSLGIDDPVTRDSSLSETHYIDNLAKQVVLILQQPVKEQGGMMSLADAYCRVNRARGLELLSAEDLLRACKRLDQLALPLSLRKFDSGAMVLQLTSHNDHAVIQQTTQLMSEKGWLTAEMLAQELGMSVLLAKEHLLTTENQGAACRDESIEGLKFYPNLFREQT